MRLLNLLVTESASAIPFLDNHINRCLLKLNDNELYTLKCLVSSKREIIHNKGLGFLV